MSVSSKASICHPIEAEDTWEQTTLLEGIRKYIELYTECTFVQREGTTLTLLKHLTNERKEGEHSAFGHATNYRGIGGICLVK